MLMNIFVIEDNSIYREVLCEFLESRLNCHICGAAGTAQEARALLPRTEAALALIDMELPDGNGLELIGELQSALPDLRCLILSVSDRVGHVEQAFAMGAWGYVVKGSSRDLEEAIQHMAAGKFYLSRRLWPALSGLAHSTR